MYIFNVKRHLERSDRVNALVSHYFVKDNLSIIVYFVQHCLLQSSNRQGPEEKSA